MNYYNTVSPTVRSKLLFHVVVDGGEAAEQDEEVLGAQSANSVVAAAVLCRQGHQ